MVFLIRNFYPSHQDVISLDFQKMIHSYHFIFYYLPVPFITFYLITNNINEEIIKTIEVKGYRNKLIKYPNLLLFF